MKNNKSKLKTFRILSSENEEPNQNENNCEFHILIGNSDEILYRAKVEKLRKLHGSFMQEGRMTLEFLEETSDRASGKYIPQDISLKTSHKPVKTLMVMMKNVSPEILKNFGKKMTEIKKKAAPSTTTPSTPS